MRMRVVDPYKSFYLRQRSPVAIGIGARKAARHGQTSRLSTVSSRGQQAAGLLPSYLSDAREVTKYCPDSAPDGALQLGVAESLLMPDWMGRALNEIRPPIPEDAIYYQPTAGRRDFLEAMAGYIEDTLQLNPKRIIPENLVVGSGCNAVLENLCTVLADSGDSVLVPTPYYAAFEFDLGARAGLSVVPVRTADFHGSNPSALDQYYPTPKALDAAYSKALEAGTPPRILLISHPHNPLGICYPPEVVSACIEWCNKRRVHLISDEIYAGSCYREGGFRSVLHGELGPYVHWVYSLSKDFAVSGLRIGAAYSENKDVHLPLQKLNDLCQISSTTQIWARAMMEHKHESQLWTDAYRKENHRRLEARCARLCSVLDDCGIPYLLPTAGLFVWIDLSSFLPTDPSLSVSEKERKLYLHLVKEVGLLLTPGLSMKNEKPGYFRCVFTAATEEEFELSLKRFQVLSNTPRC